jgi:L-threonylcarbamoyladenylate synthase
VIDAAVAAVRAGKPVILPTDTVYGLACSPYRETYVRGLARLKGRDEMQPIALAACELDLLFECVPELRGRAGTIARALLPGPYTLVLENPARRFNWLNGASPATIGVRVPDVDGVAKELLDSVGAVAATSANLPGGPDPRRVEDVPEKIRAAAVVLHGGELPGTASTVIDFTGVEPRVLREGAAPSDEALRTVASVV